MDYVVSGGSKFPVSNSVNICIYDMLVIDGRVFYIFPLHDRYDCVISFTLVSEGVLIKFKNLLSSKKAAKSVRRYLEGLPSPYVLSAYTARIKKSVIY